MLKTSSHIIIKYSLVFILSAMFFSCSTKKKTWFHRTYHNTTAKYNGYFNGKESLKAGVKKIHKEHKDDYTQILPIFPTGDLKGLKKTHSYMDKAIRKASVVIQKHSIKIKGKEYCKWIDDNYLLLGMGYFYKGENDEAIKTFSFIKTSYKDKKIIQKATVWLIRAYINKGDFMLAKSEIKALERKRILDKKTKIEFLKASSEYYIETNELDLAAKNIEELIKMIKRKSNKVRYYYVLSQIYQQTNRRLDARKLMQKALRASSDYEMTFNAKMTLARLGEGSQKDNKKTLAQLLKMVKDDKNKEYLDQIYFTLGQIYMYDKDTSSAISMFSLSTKNSVNNNSQKAISFLSLAEIQYAKKEYINSSICFDSCIYYMQETNEKFNEVERRAKTINMLANNLAEINLQDSLILLANLPKEELNKIINSRIELEIQREKEKQEINRIRQQAVFDNNKNSGRGQQFGSNTSGGKWYFYNPATLSFGFSEFQKKWGKRKLEDDWRRKNKKTQTGFANDSIKADTTKSIKIENNKNPQYYYSQLPTNKIKKQLAEQKIKEAMYQAGTIFKQELNKYFESTEMFLDLYNRYPKDKQYAPLSLFQSMLNYEEKLDQQKANEIKEKIIESFPNSIYAKMLNGEETVLKGDQEKEQDRYYMETYELFQSGNYQKVLERTSKIKKEYENPKVKILRAISYARLNDTISAINELQTTLQKQLNKDLENKVNFILTNLRDPSKIKEQNLLVSRQFSYLFDKKETQTSILIIKKSGVDINYLKTLISDFHQKTYPNKPLEISALLIGLENYLLMIKSFDNVDDVLKYNIDLENDESILEQLSRSSYRIMAITDKNFKDFYKKRDLEGYYQFYQKKYLNN